MFGGVLGWKILAAAGLTVTSTTPDALCPSLESARAAVSARVGEVEGGPFEAQMTVVRSAIDSGATLRLVLLDPDGAAILERTFPLSESDCAVAAQTVAYVLERHFDGLDEGPQASGELETGPGDGKGDGAASSDSVDPADDSPELGDEGSSSSEPARGGQERSDLPATKARIDGSGEQSSGTTRSLALRAGVGITSEGSPQVLGGLAFFWGENVGSSLDLTVPLIRSEHVTDDYTLESSRSGIHWGGLLGARKESFALYGGPELSVFRDKAHLEGEAVEIGARNTRLAGGLGLQALVSARLVSSLWIDLLPRVGGVFWGPDFIVAGLPEETRSPLGLPALYWDVSVALRFDLWSNDAE